MAFARLPIARRMSDCVSGHSFATSYPTEPDAVTGDPNRLCISVIQDGPNN